MGDNNYPTPAYRAAWDDFVRRVYQAHPAEGVAVAKILAWEEAKKVAQDGSPETAAAFERAEQDALTPA